VSERVVDLFEAVEVEVEQRPAVTVPLRRRERLLDTLVHRRPVRQSGQGVEIRQVFDPGRLGAQFRGLLLQTQAIRDLGVLGGDPEPTRGDGDRRSADHHQDRVGRQAAPECAARGRQRDQIRAAETVGQQQAAAPDERVLRAEDAQ